MPTDADPTQTPGPQDPGTNRHAPLLGLIHRIIVFGRDLIATLQRQNNPKAATPVAERFGTFNLALIIARITRGLAIAARLELRLLRTGRTHPPNPDHPTKPTRPRPARPPEPPRPPKLSRAEDEAALLRGLPSAREIAAMIRRRPAGAVLVDICRDLGIDASHPFWRDIRDALFGYNGSLAHMMTVWRERRAAMLATFPDSGMTSFVPPARSQASSLDAGNVLLAASTGPP